MSRNNRWIPISWSLTPINGFNRVVAMPHPTGRYPPAYGTAPVHRRQEIKDFPLLMGRTVATSAASCDNAVQRAHGVSPILLSTRTR